VCHDPLSVRDLVHRLDSRSYGVLLDVGHAHVVAGFMGVELCTLLEPVLDDVRLFHVHDNLGARLGGEGSAAIDPLQLDLHLPPGGGSIPWDTIAPALLAHPAPLMMEVHPAHRSAPGDLWRAAASAFGGLPRSAPPVGGAEAASAAAPASSSGAGRRAT
jgi:sugar phosphate isomerase/epimerase